jgi:hypothetical protein
MKQSFNSICNSIFKRNQTMKYLLMMAMFFSLTTSVLAEGGSARVIEYTYNHRIRFVDPSNNPSDPLGISNPQVGVNITGGVDCVPGIANCVGGSNAVGTVDSVYYVNGNPVTVQSVNTYQRVKMGKYYNPTDMSKLDKTFSNLTSLTYTLKKGGSTVWTITFNYASDLASTSAASPYTFFQYDALTGGTWLGEGSIHKDDEGAIHFTSAPLITSTLDENAEFELTVTPTVSSPTIVSTPGTATYLGEAICATAPKSGETKYTSVSNNHEGWYLMDGTPTANITNPNARAAAQMLFGASLPNTFSRYVVSSNPGSVSPYTTSGSATTLINANNLPALTGGTSTDGDHSHSFSVFRGIDDYSFSGSSSSANDTGSSGFNQGTSTNGNHSHSVTVNSGSPNTPISIIPPTVSLYHFVYLGK